MVVKYFMKNISLLLSAAILFLSSCSSTKSKGSESNKNSDSLAVADTMAQQPYGSMRINPSIQIGDSVLLTFTVYNNTAKKQSFCKWHTPFEPPMSKYLDITLENGKEVQYHGAMAKRVMPPPANSYIELGAKDSVSITIDLRKSYQFEEAGRYILKYNSQDISGISVKDSVSFLYKK